MNWFWDKPRFGDYHEIYDLNMQPGDKITFWLLLLVLPPAMALLLWWSGLQFGSRHFLWLLLAVPPALALFF